MIDNEIRNGLSSLLSDNEQILWTGKPPKGFLLRKSDIFFIPFSIIWFGFAIFWEAIVIFSGAPFFFIIFGLLFVAVGLYIFIGRFFVDSYKRKNTVYAITNDRIIIKSKIFTNAVNSINIRTLSRIKFTENSRGLGTINLDAGSFKYNGIAGVESPVSRFAPKLEMIPNVKKVYNIIVENQR